MARRRSLIPREHGAYFQLGIPLIAAWCARAPTVAGLAVGLGAVGAFFLHEPLVVALGARGDRARDAAGARARRWVGALGPATAACGIAGLALAPATLAFAAAAAVAGAVVFALALRRGEHTLAGELAATVALTGASASVLVADGVAPSRALVWWLGWSFGYGATVVAVRRVIARHRRPLGAPIDDALAVVLPAATIALVASPLAVTAGPLAALATVVVIAPPRVAHLRAVGIAIALAAAGAAVVAVA